MQAFILYVRAYKTCDNEVMKELEIILDQNVKECVQEINARIPGIGFIIGRRFHESMRAELLLLSDVETAVTELKSCHVTMIHALNVAFGQRTKWEVLWRDQLHAMLNILLSDTELTYENCMSTAQLLGNSFDALTR